VSGIGVLREGPLHAAIKARIAQPGDRTEVTVGRYVIDLVRADGELVEIQTGGFAPLGRKLDALLDAHRIRIVVPIAAQRRIVRVDEQGEVLAARRSPRRATATEVFDRIVSFPSLLTHPNLTLELLLLAEDHVRGAEPVRMGRRQRLRDPGQRRLGEILERIVVHGPADLLALVPALPRDASFSCRELAEAAGCSVALAQRIVYCLRGAGLLEPAGQRGRAPLHRLTSAPQPPPPAPPNRTIRTNNRR
jgi:hypothetical protein